MLVDAALDLFDLVLADVADVQQLVVERPPPRIAQTDRPHLGGAILTVGVRVVRRNAIRLGGAGPNFDPQHGGEQSVGSLAVAEAVIRGAAIAEPEPQIAVGTKGDHASVVVGGRLVDSQQFPSRVGVGRVGITRRDLVLDQPGITISIDVVDVEQAIRCVVGVERETEQALLVVEGDQRFDVEEGQHRSFVDHPDPPGLVDHEQAGITRRGDDEHRLLESVCHGFSRKHERTARCRRRRRDDLGRRRGG